MDAYLSIDTARTVLCTLLQNHNIPVMVGNHHNGAVGELKRGVLKLMLALLEGSVPDVVRPRRLPFDIFSWPLSGDEVRAVAVLLV